MKDAVDAFNKADYDKCIEYCTEEIENSNDYILEARNLRGSLYMLKCQYNECKDDFNSILNDPKSSNRLKSNTLIKLTALNLQNNQDKEAYDNYDKAIELDPSNEDIYCNRAQVHAIKSNFAECFKDFETCLEINPSHRVAKLQKAFFEFRQFYTQLSIYLQATQTSQEELSRYLENSKELRAETEKLEKFIHEYDDVPEAYNLYAQILSEQENFAKAEQFYEKALQKDPKNAALIVQRALNLMTWKNDLDMSIDMLNSAIVVDDTCEFAYETLATVEIQR
jgi:import receptor subunit TOM70